MCQARGLDITGWLRAEMIDWYEKWSACSEALGEVATPGQVQNYVDGNLLEGPASRRQSVPVPVSLSPREPTNRPRSQTLSQSRTSSSPQAAKPKRSSTPRRKVGEVDPGSDCATMEEEKEVAAQWSVVGGAACSSTPQAYQIQEVLASRKHLSEMALRSMVGQLLHGVSAEEVGNQAVATDAMMAFFTTEEIQALLIQAVAQVELL